MYQHFNSELYDIRKLRQNYIKLSEHGMNEYSQHHTLIRLSHV